MPPKRKSSEERGGAAKRPALQCTNKQHLYLLLDDWERGYSVRRLDIDAFEPDDLPPPERFTEPPVARIEAEAAEYESERNFVSHGAKIFAHAAWRSQPCHPGLRRQHAGPVALPVTAHGPDGPGRIPGHCTLATVAPKNTVAPEV